jgi:signal transduction histidine kinase
VNYTLSQQVNQNSTFLTNSETIIRNSGRLNKSIIDMQSAFRGYLLTDDDDFLEPYYSSLKEIPTLFKEQSQLVQEYPVHRQRLDSIKVLHQEWIDYANSLISAKKKLGDKGDYETLFNTRFRKQFGQKLNNQISDKFREFDRYEYKVRQVRRETLSESISQTNTYSIIFLGVIICIGAISTIYIVRLISKRIAAMVNVAHNISNGNFVNVEDNQNDELTSLSTSLNIMSATLNKNIRELEKRNNELNQFAYVVSHDLKAPLRGIYNVTQWIEEDLQTELSPSLKRYLNIIPERIARMEGLIDGLLDYARIAREKPLKEYVDVNILVRDIVDDIVPKDTEISIGRLPGFATDKLRLEQVFSNLISNAVKYGSAEHPRIGIDCHELPKFYEFTVSDNGIGIDPGYHDKIFVIFQTLREKNAKESTGIGLAIVKKILDDQHCSIRVESEPGHGSSFIFTWNKN